MWMEIIKLWLIFWLKPLVKAEVDKKWFYQKKQKMRRVWFSGPKLHSVKILGWSDSKYILNKSLFVLFSDPYGVRFSLYFDFIVFLSYFLLSEYKIKFFPLLTPQKNCCERNVKWGPRSSFLLSFNVFMTRMFLCKRESY